MIQTIGIHKKYGDLEVLKDIDVISRFLQSNNLKSPTFEAAADLYNKSKENIPITHDTAAIFEQLKLNNE